MNRTHFLTIGLLLVIVPLIGLPAARVQTVLPAHPAVAASGRTHVAEALRSSPVMFIENVGQFDERARFQVRGAMGTMWLAEEAIWITVVERSHVEMLERFDLERANAKREDEQLRGANLKLTFPGANPHPRIEPFDRLDIVVSYFIGNDPEKWRPNVPVWAGVRYVNLYPGVDLVITGQNGSLVQQLVARAGADTDAAHLRVEGADKIELDGNQLRLTTAVGDITLPLLQVASHDSTPLNLATSQSTLTGNEIHAPFTTSNTEYPIPNTQQDNPDDLLYSTFLGGGDYDHSNAIVVDRAGNIYVTGATGSSDFPTTAGAFDTSHNSNYDAFVVKVDASRTGLLYATFLGGGSTDVGGAIALDGAGNVYVTGGTSSSDFPTTVGAFDTYYGGGTCGTYPTWPCSDAFVAKLNTDGSGLVYSTFLGGSSGDGGGAIVVDGAGNVYMAGTTGSADFPTTAGAFDTSHNGPGGTYGGDAFVVKLNASGTGLVYSTFLGGSSEDGGDAIVVDGAGVVYMTGTTESSDFPTTAGAFDTSHNGDRDAFVAKLDADGSGLVYTTLLGGSGDDYGHAITVNGTGSAYVTGTASSGFPTTPGAFDTSHNGNYDAFVVKLNVSGSGLTYATFLGGGSYDYGNAIAIDRTGSAYVAGDTQSSDFPTTAGAFDTSYRGSRDVYLVKLNTGGTDLIYSTFMGGSDSDDGNAVVVDGTGGVYVVGYTRSSDFPTTPGAFDTSYNGSLDAFVAKLAVGGGPGPTYSISGRVTDNTGAPIYSATVSASGPANVSTFTGGDGRYTLSNLPAGTYSINVSVAGYIDPPPRNVTVPPDATNVDFVLQRETYSISGQVTDNAGISISGAKVSASGPTDVFDITGDDGRYSLFSLPAGTYSVSASKAGYISPPAQSVPVPPDATNVDFVLQRETYSISGQVADDAGTSISGARVSASGPTDVFDITGDYGRYSLFSLPAGTYSINVSVAGYIDPPPRNVHVPPDATNVDFVLQRETYSISGQVTDGHGSPLVGISVSLWDTGANQLASDHTKAGGRYDFDEVPVRSGYMVEVILIDDDQRKQIQWGNNRLSVIVETPSFTPTDKSYVRDISFTDSTLTSSVPFDVLDDLAGIYYHTQTVEQFIREDIGFQDYLPPRTVWAFAPTANSDDVYYCPGPHGGGLHT